MTAASRKGCQESARREVVSCACRYRDSMAHEVPKAKRDRALDARLPAKGTSTQVQDAHVLVGA